MFHGFQGVSGMYHRATDIFKATGTPGLIQGISGFSGALQVTSEGLRGALQGVSVGLKGVPCCVSGVAGVFPGAS